MEARRKGRDLTQVHVLSFGALRVWDTLVHSIQQLVFGLGDAVTVENLHRDLSTALALRAHTMKSLRVKEPQHQSGARLLHPFSYSHGLMLTRVL